MQKKNRSWIPEIMYEENSSIPFIQVPSDQPDPHILFIFVNRETGETEPDFEGNESSVVEMDLRQFADLKILKENLSEDEYDRVRSVLGLKPLKEAVKKGQEINERVAKNLSLDKNS
jgi:hypothetical protein